MNLKWGKLKIVGSSLAILIACGVVGVSLYAYFNRTLTWFTRNRVVEATGMQMAAKEENKVNIARMLVYKYEITTDHIIVKREENPQKPEDLTLNEYDTVFVERQPYTPMLVKVPVEQTRGRAFTIHIKCSGEQLDENGWLADNLSNLIYIKCGMSSNLDKNYADESQQSAKDLYDAAKAFFTDPEYEVDGDTTPITQLGGNQDTYCLRRFTTYSGGALDTKTKEITIKVGPHDVQKYAGQGDQDQANIYFYIDYDAGLAEKFLKDRPAVSASSIAGGSSVKLKADLVSIVFGEENTEDE